MGTPPKNIGQFLESPYAKHLSQYPSQSEGYVPDIFGGKVKDPTSTPHQNQNQGYSHHQNNHNNPRQRGNNRYFNVNRGAGPGGHHQGRGGYRNNYQGHYQNNYNSQHTNRYSNSGNRQQPYHGQRFNKAEGSSRNEYFHPSMLKDPWKDLMDRHNAIKSSQINVSQTTGRNSPDLAQDEPSMTEKTMPATTIKQSASISS